MAEQQPNPPGPDFTKGVSVADIAAGQMLLGHVNQDAVLLARQGDEFLAIGATCSHYSGPLAEGLMAGDTVRCPWHHARFSLRTGEAIGAPAFNALPCWRVEKSDDKVFVRERTAPANRSEPSKRARATAKPDAHRHRGRRCRGICCRRDAAARRIWRQSHARVGRQ